MSFPFELQKGIFSLDDHDNIREKFTRADQEFGTTNTNQIQPNGAEIDCGEFATIDDSSLNYGLFQDYNQCLAEESLFSKSQPRQQQQQQISDYGLLDYPQCNVASPSLEACLEEIAKFGQVPNETKHVGVVKKSKAYPFSLASLELLNNYGTGFRRLTGERIVQQVDRVGINAKDHRRSSTEEILRIAGARFIQSALPTSHPFEGSFSGMSNEESKDVELVELLLASAEKVGLQQHESAARLLNLCENLCSNTGNPVQRVVYYFCEALRERIDRETGRFASKDSGKLAHQTLDINKAMIMQDPPDASKLAFHRGLPFSQAEKVAAALTIAENVAPAKKLHVIDLRIGFGIHWTALMQALASQNSFPVELLKITAIGTAASKHSIEEAGKWMSNFAYAMKIPLSFNVVMLQDIISSPESEGAFEVEGDETLAVYSSYGLSRLIPQPNQLETLMRAIRALNPRVMVVTEVESSQNSSAFFTRFIETLFYYGASFDCLEASMKPDDTNRVVFESLYCGVAIRNIVAAEGEERVIRNVKVQVWRAFFARFGMEEIALSQSSIEQAKLVAINILQQCGNNSCTFEMDGKCLIMGWKGTPLHSLSAWRFLN
uniref:DELLA RGL1-like protein n=1 Tax=Boehmeria nivea TaxID=83906 RepID=A0A5J6WHL6_BOENI|nr:DELLA RGL1-like protein [Boehmeria nivea]